jgi:hypothetical protein
MINIEMCLINNWQVVSANTDGIEVLVPKYRSFINTKNLDINMGENLNLEHEYCNKIVC